MRRVHAKWAAEPAPPGGFTRGPPLVRTPSDLPALRPTALFGCRFAGLGVERAGAVVIDAIRYTINYLRDGGYSPAVVTLLEATSPVRRVEDLDKAIAAVLHDKADTAASFHETEVSPNRLWKVDETIGTAGPYLEGAQPFLPRQQQPKAYQLNGQIYAFSPAVLDANPKAISIILGRVYPIVTPRAMAIDIDEEFDLLVAEQVLRRYAH